MCDDPPAGGEYDVTRDAGCSYGLKDQGGDTLNFVLRHAICTILHRGVVAVLLVFVCGCRDYSHFFGDRDLGAAPRFDLTLGVLEDVVSPADAASDLSLLDLGGPSQLLAGEQDPTATPAADYIPANYANAYVAKAVTTGTARNFHLFLDNASTQSTPVQVAVYDDVDGKPSGPNVLLGRGAATGTCGGCWMVVALDTPVSILAGHSCA
jgi:hypothetical protein